MITKEEMIKVIKGHYPPENYTMLRKTLDYCMDMLTPPTEQEVCEAYYKQYNCGLLYNKNSKEFVEVKGGRSRGKIIARKVGECLEFKHPIHSHIVTKISRFFEVDPQ